MVFESFGFRREGHSNSYRSVHGDCAHHHLLNPSTLTTALRVAKLKRSASHTGVRSSPSFDESSTSRKAKPVQLRRKHGVESTSSDVCNKSCPLVRPAPRPPTAPASHEDGSPLFSSAGRGVTNRASSFSETLHAANPRQQPSPRLPSPPRMRLQAIVAPRHGTEGGGSPRQKPRVFRRREGRNCRDTRPSRARAPPQRHPSPGPVSVTRPRGLPAKAPPAHTRRQASA